MCHIKTCQIMKDNLRVTESLRILFQWMFFSLSGTLGASKQQIKIVNTVLPRAQFNSALLP